MNLEELKKDLLDKTGSNGFKVKIFKKDGKIYERRSFIALFTYYRRFKVSEKLLMRALKELEFTGRYCGDAKSIVFFKINKKDYCGIYKPRLLFWFYPHFRSETIDYIKPEKLGKYTVFYLENLWNNCDK